MTVKERRRARRKLSYYRATSIQLVTAATAAAIERTIAEQGSRFKGLNRHHIYLLIACKIANEGSKWFTRKQAKAIATKLPLPIGIYYPAIGNNVNDLLRFHFINPLRVSKKFWQPQLFEVSRTGDGLLIRLGVHFNTILDTLEDKDARMALKQDSEPEQPPR